MKPFEVPEAIDRYNKTTLLEIVNNPDTFDTDLKPRKRDRLSLHFEVGEGGFMDYGYEFDGEKWVAEDYHEFMWNAEHEEAQYGKINNGLRNTGY